MGAQNTQNREVFNQNITKNVPKNGLKWCNIADMGAFQQKRTIIYFQIFENFEKN